METCSLVQGFKAFYCFAVFIIGCARRTHQEATDISDHGFTIITIPTNIAFGTTPFWLKPSLSQAIQTLLPVSFWYVLEAGSLCGKFISARNLLLHTVFDNLQDSCALLWSTRPASIHLMKIFWDARSMIALRIKNLRVVRLLLKLFQISGSVTTLL